MKKHLHTRFVNFLIEKYNEDPEMIEDEDFSDEWEQLPLDHDEDEDEPRRNTEEDEKSNEDEGINDDEVIDKLVNEYRNIKKGYDKLVQKRRRRKTL